MGRQDFKLKIDLPGFHPSRNSALAEMSATDLGLMTPYLSSEYLAHGTVLTEVNHQIDRVYFPLSGMVSIVILMQDGKAIETGMIGRSGIVGAAAGLGLHRSRARSIVQIDASVLHLPVARFRDAVATSPTLLEVCLNNQEVLLTQARVAAACNALHQLDARFARWLLETSAIIDSDTISLTQEFLSEMLGVRRTSITAVASKLQAAGIIRYSRGVIEIKDSDRLEQAACECYRMLHPNPTET